uniref:Anaphase-promoting complex subunit 4 n=1 Tax=Romanomermis culicivorax TaxID=13658 RepID=A0A915JKB5_ROMCU
MSPYVFKEHSDRNSSSEIKLLTWNSKYDLLALANFKGEVCLQRIFWRKAWDYANPFEEQAKKTANSKTEISNLCWSPRGDCLCVCYTNLRVQFLEIENGKLVHEIRLSEEISSNELKILVKWRQSDELNFRDRLNFPDLVLETKILRKNTNGESIFKSNKVQATFDSIFLNKDYVNYLTMLIFARGSKIDLYLNGYLHVCSLNLLDDNPQILDLQLTPDFDNFIFLIKSNCNINCYRINSNKFRRRIVDVSSFVERLGKSMTSSENVNTCLKTILHSFDDILKDLTSKFRRFAQDKFLVDENSTIGDEFINVLAFGTFSPELQTFLTQDLNDKNLKKLSLNLENTYANLRRSISSILISSLSTLFYHLNELNEFSRSNFPLLDETILKWTLTSCQNTILKSRQTLDVLDSSLEDFRLFASWLRKICYLVSEDDRQQKQNQNFDQFSNNDLQRILNFIRENFQVKYNGPENCDKNLFKIERIGQYLVDAELSDKSDDLNKEHSSTSLVQDIKILNEKFHEFFDSVSKNVSRSDWFEIQKIQTWPSTAEQISNVLVKYDWRRQIFRLFFYDTLKGKIEIYEQQVQNNKIKIATPPTFFFVKKLDILCPENVVIVENLRDYNVDSICFLISERKKSEMIKYKIGIMDDKIFDDYCVKSVSLVDNEHFLWQQPMTDRNLFTIWLAKENIKLQNLKNGPYCQWAVCGSRKIACVLHSTRTRLKLLEMDPEEMSMSSSFELADQEEAMSGIQ